MTFFSKRKRKNDDPPRFPAWILVLIAIGLVIIIAVFFQSSVRQTSPVAANSFPADLLTATKCVRLNTPQLNITASNSNFDPLELTATAIVGIATSEAQGTLQSCVSQAANNLDLLELKATSMVEEATAMAQGTPEGAFNLDPLEMTATAIVKWATEQVTTPQS